MREATTASGVDNAASRRRMRRFRDYFTLRERLIAIKQLEGTQKYINERYDADFLSMTTLDIVSNTPLGINA